MKLSYEVAMVAAAAVLSAALLLAPTPGLGQAAEDERAELTAAERTRVIDRFFENKARQLTVFDREGNVVSTIGEPDMYIQPNFSPDRTRVAVVKVDLGGNTSSLWVFDLTTGDRTQITSSQTWYGLHSPVWSPDGSQIAYVEQRGSYEGLYRQASNGEGEEELLYEHPGYGITLTDWSLDGRFLSFYSAGVWGGILYLLPLDGDGQAIEVTHSESIILAEARLSPDSRFLAYRSDETGRNEIFVRSVALSDGTNASVEKWQVSTEGGLGMASWRRDGQELYYFAADRGVMAVEVNTAEGFEFGQPTRLFRAPDVIPVRGIPGTVNWGIPVAYGNVSRDGQRVVFAVPGPPQLRQITVFDREGNVVSRVGEPGLYDRPAFSPDGSRVAVVKQDLKAGNLEIWTFDVSTGEGMPVTSDNFLKDSPLWSPDGTYVAYASNREHYYGIYRKAWSGEGSEELLFRYTPGAEIDPRDYSADGRFLSVTGGEIVLVVPLTGTDPLAREAIEFVRDEFEADWGRFSPDGRFLAYTSDETGRNEVYVRPFDASSGTAPTQEKWQITEDGGSRANWRQDGKEIIYVSQGGMMAVDVTTTPEFQVGTPRLLFRSTGFRRSRPGNRYVGPDGQRFVFTVFTMPVASGTPAP